MDSTALVVHVREKPLDVVVVLPWRVVVEQRPGLGGVGTAVLVEGLQILADGSNPGNGHSRLVGLLEKVVLDSG